MPDERRYGAMDCPVRLGAASLPPSIIPRAAPWPARTSRTEFAKPQHHTAVRRLEAQFLATPAASDRFEGGTPVIEQWVIEQRYRSLATASRR